MPQAPHAPAQCTGQGPTLHGVTSTVPSAALHVAFVPLLRATVAMW
jgi:hypothetical protein